MNLGRRTGIGVEARSEDAPPLTVNGSGDAAVIALPPVHKSQFPIKTLVVGIVWILNVLVLRNVNELLREARGTRSEGQRIINACFRRVAKSEVVHTKVEKGAVKLQRARIVH